MNKIIVIVIVIRDLLHLTTHYDVPTTQDFNSYNHFVLFIGYFSWRNSAKGSWFVQALASVFQQYGQKEEIMWMMARVNRYAFNF